MGDLGAVMGWEEEEKYEHIGRGPVMSTRTGSP